MVFCIMLFIVRLLQEFRKLQSFRTSEKIDYCFIGIQRLSQVQSYKICLTLRGDVISSINSTFLSLMKTCSRKTGHPSFLKECFRFLACAQVSFFFVSATRSSCTSPAVFEREDAIVTCTFDTDISTLGLEFELRYRPINVSEFGSEIVLSCYWRLRKPVCRSRPGYQLGSNVTHEFSVKISAVNNNHAGKYACLVVPHDIGSHEYCDLVIKASSTPEITSGITVNFKEGNPVFDLKSPRPVIDSVVWNKHVFTLTSHAISTPLLEKLQNSKDSGGKPDTVFISLIVTVSIGVIVVIIITVITCVIYRRRKHSKSAQPLIKPEVKPDVKRFKNVSYKDIPENRNGAENI